jgi:hypothetical protein
MGAPLVVLDAVEVKGQVAVVVEGKRWAMSVSHGPGLRTALSARTAPKDHPTHRQLVH